MPPNCRTITRLTGNNSPDWRHFTDGGFERQVGGSDLAGWGIAAVSPDNFVRLLCGPVMCVILATWHFQEPPRAATTLRNSLVLLTLPDGFVFSSLAAKRYVFCSDSKHAARVTFGVDHARRNITSACQCNELLLRSKCLFPHLVSSCF